MKTKDQLFYQYKHLAVIIGLKYLKIIPSHSELEHDDLVQIGYLTIIEILEKNDRLQNDYSEKELNNYLSMKIKWAILNEMRKQDLASPDERRESKKIARQYNELCQILKRKPYNYEFMHYLEITDSDQYFEKIRLFLGLPRMFYLFEMTENYELSDTDCIDRIINKSVESTFGNFDNDIRKQIDLKNMYEDVVDLLKFSDDDFPQDKKIKTCLKMFLLEEQRGEDIAKKMKISSSMVWNYLGEGQKWVRNKMKNKYGEKVIS